MKPLPRIGSRVRLKLYYDEDTKYPNSEYAGLLPGEIGIVTDINKKLSSFSVNDHEGCYPKYWDYENVLHAEEFNNVLNTLIED